jgi:hypothetical protein
MPVDFNLGSPGGRGELWKEVSDYISGQANNGVTGITDPLSGKKYVRNKRGVHTTDEVGLFADGADKTAAANAVCAVAELHILEVLAEAGGGIVINGTWDANFKVLKFRPGTYITGTGTINNFILDSRTNHLCFGPGLTLNAAGTTNSSWYPKNFGAAVDGSTDDQPALQRLSDMLIKSPTLARKIDMGKGSYKVNKMWNLHNWNGSKYDFWTLHIQGEISGYFTTTSYKHEDSRNRYYRHADYQCAGRQIRYHRRA